jgi:hypothetical protein
MGVETMGFGKQAAQHIRAGAVIALFGALSFVPPALAQDDIPPEMQCLRYIQSQERNLGIPGGLLTAIGLVEAGRPMDNGQSVIWPWTVNVNGQGRYFATKEEAVNETRKLMDEGQRSIDVGCVQVNLRYHPNAFRTLDEAFDPATNVAYGAQFLQSLHELQGSWPNAVERFHSSEDGRRAEYRDKVLAVWNDAARNLIMDQVMAENTDTPYHQALRDFVAGRYAQALDKYQGIVDVPTDGGLAVLRPLSRGGTRQRERGFACHRGRAPPTAAEGRRAARGPREGRGQAAGRAYRIGANLVRPRPERSGAGVCHRRGRGGAGRGDLRAERRSAGGQAEP